MKLAGVLKRTNNPANLDYPTLTAMREKKQVESYCRVVQVKGGLTFVHP